MWFQGQCNGRRRCHPGGRLGARFRKGTVGGRLELGDAFWKSAENFSLGYFVDTLGIDDDYFLKDVSDPLQTIAAILLGSE